MPQKVCEGLQVRLISHYDAQHLNAGLNVYDFLAGFLRQGMIR